MTEDTFRVGISGDMRASDGGFSWGDISHHLLDEPGIVWEFLKPADRVTVQQLERYDALLIAAPAVRGEEVRAAAKVPQIIARFGVGVDSVDLQACTEREIVVTNTPDGARRPVAQAALALTLAAMHHMSAKDMMVRLGSWEAKLDWNGRSLNGATVGLVGLGNIGAEFARLVQVFDVTLLAFDPYQPESAFERAGARAVDLDELLASSDAVVIFAPLTPETHHLINTSNIGRVKPGSYLINIARGEIVEHEALVTALRERRLAGAGLDVFEKEPLSKTDPLVKMPNVVLAPHALSWTDEMARGNGASAINAILDIRAGQLPTYLVNRQLRTPEFERKLENRASHRSPRPRTPLTPIQVG